MHTVNYDGECRRASEFKKEKKLRTWPLGLLRQTAAFSFAIAGS